MVMFKNYHYDTVNGIASYLEPYALSGSPLSTLLSPLLI